MSETARIRDLLNGKGENYIFPFFWQHGEDEETLREYMRVIHEANIGAVCVECRPHPDFCGPKWWTDMDIILDEARQRNMKVWILDDDHFPTGHANGGIENADISLRPWYVDVVCADCYGPSPENRFDIRAAIHKEVNPAPMPQDAFLLRGAQKLHFEDDEEILSVTAYQVDENGLLADCTDVSEYVQDGVLTWDVPNGSYRIFATFLTHNGDGRTDYINILDHDSVRVLIDRVYEKHYEKYKEEFGKTIAGFFSDEPMVGNIKGMYQTGQLGGERKLTNPWQKDIPQILEKSLGADWKKLLPLLWNEGAEEITNRVRIAYMDAVTELISRNFSGQLARWCEAHGVEYIGHIWEDAHLSSALGGGLGHYFRAMDGNHMGGVDIVFSSSMKPWSDHRVVINKDAPFYYHALGRLASSHANIDPRKKGRSLCEIFGATGWDFGVDKMKYLADNFLVNGVNHYVPHAFSPQAFPDPDCPPHFYAHGENAQYRHFCKLMQYMQRVCHLISGGMHMAEVAVLYNAESDWVSERADRKYHMFCEEPAEILAKNQIEYDIIPIDLLRDPESLCGDKLVINGVRYSALVVPASDYTTPELVEFSKRAEKEGFPVLFVDNIPAAAVNSGMKEYSMEQCHGILVGKNALADRIRSLGIGDIRIAPASHSVICYHYRETEDLLVLVNNDLGRPYKGTVTVPTEQKAYIYDAYENAVYAAKQTIAGGKSCIEVTVRAYNPVILFFGEYDGALSENIFEYADEIQAAIQAAGAAGAAGTAGAAGATEALEVAGTEIMLKDFRLSSCAATAYPEFGPSVTIKECRDIQQIHPEMMDYYRYETEFELSRSGEGRFLLKMDYISDGTEVWCNGVHCGQRIASPWVFDLTKAVREGSNSLRIEVAATPDRKVKAMNLPEGFSMQKVPSAVQPEGIIGNVRVLTC